MDELLFDGPFRDFPLPAKNVLTIARSAPDLLNSEAFRRMCEIAADPAASGWPVDPSKVNPLFKPGLKLYEYYCAMSEARAADAGHSLMAASSGGLAEPAQLSSRWTLKHDIEQDIDAGLAKAKELRTALDAYRASQETPVAESVQTGDREA